MLVLLEAFGEDSLLEHTIEDETSSRVGDIGDLGDFFEEDLVDIFRIDHVKSVYVDEVEVSLEG
jgi:hypothetical protein